MRETSKPIDSRINSMDRMHVFQLNGHATEDEPLYAVYESQGGIWLASTSIDPVATSRDLESLRKWKIIT